MYIDNTIMIFLNHFLWNDYKVSCKNYKINTISVKYSNHCISKFFGTVSEEATLWIQVVGGEWEQIEIKYPTIETNKNFSSWLDVQDIDLKKYIGKEIKVGFKYVSTDKNAGTWEIKDVKVVKATAAGVNAITLDKTNAPLYNLAGQRVSNNYKGVVVKNGKKYFNK